MHRQTIGQGVIASRGRGGTSESGAPSYFHARVFNVTQQTMQQSGQFMHELCNGTRQSYKRGCRCDLCKSAESEYKRDLRRRQREAVGEFVTRPVTLSLVSGSSGVSHETPAYAGGPVESAVALEIQSLGDHHRPGVAAACLALAAVLDNPKAVSTQPAAAAKLFTLLETLRKRAIPQSKLASVRALTSKKET